MTSFKTKTFGILVAAAMLGCGEFDVPDLNNPSVEVLERNPTRSALFSAATGLLIGTRERYTANNGYIAQLGIIGREAYTLDPADPRFITEMLASPQLDPGSPAFGGNFWAFPYANLRNGHVVLAALKKVPGLTEEEQNATSGFTKTVQALDYLILITTRDLNGAVDVHAPKESNGLHPLVSKEAILQRMIQLLDEGAQELKLGGASFPFPLSNGFSAFNTPATFLTFNRALKARVEVYREEWQSALDALGESFLDADLGSTLEAAAAKLALGAYHSHGSGASQLPNGLVSATLFVNPDIVMAADTRENGAPDLRVEHNVEKLAEPVKASGLSSQYRFTKYPSPNSPAPIIRNEELILLRAEANFHLGNLTQAIDDINLIREKSGGLLPRNDLNAGNFVTELLKQRRYSLFMEGGHSWIDARRYGRLDTLPIDREGDRVHKAFPIPLAETNARKK